VKSPPSLLWQGASVAATIALCISLGVWQLRRLEWKENLLAAIETRAHSAPSALPERGSWPRLSSDDYAYAHVRAEGAFDLARVALVFTSAPEGGIGAEPGFLALMPLQLASGGAVIVNRGFTPQSKAEAGGWREAPGGTTVVTGWLMSPQKRNMFTPPDDPSNGKWFTADPAAIAAAFGMAEAAPFLLEQQAGAPEDGLSRPVAIDTAQIPNNHLGYAATWFGLAAAMGILFAVYAKGRLD